MKRIKQAKNPYLMSVTPHFKVAKKKNLQIDIPEDEISPQPSPAFKQYGKNSPTRSQFPPVALRNKQIINARSSGGTPKNEGTPKSALSGTPKKSSQSQKNSNKSTPKEISRTFKFPQNNPYKAHSNVFLRKNDQLATPTIKKIVNPKIMRVSHTPSNRRQIQQNGRMTPTQKAVRQMDQEEQLNQQKAETEPSITTTQLNDLVTKVPQQATSMSNQKKPDLTSKEIAQRQEEIYREHLFQTFQAMKFVQQIPNADTQQLKNKRVYLPKRPTHTNCKTLILDLDETLVHCCDDLSQNPDVVLPVTFPTKEVVNAGINIRPYVKELLIEANKN